MKLYWEKVSAVKWSPDSREGASLVAIGTRVYLFGGLSRDLH